MSKLKWCIQRIPENAEEVNEWIYKTTGSFDMIREYYVHSEPFEASRACISHLIHPGFHEITLEEFRLLTNPDKYNAYECNGCRFYGLTRVWEPYPSKFPIVSEPVFQELQRMWSERLNINTTLVKEEVCTNTPVICTARITQDDMKALIRIRNYFGENDKTQLEHMAYDVLDRIVRPFLDGSKEEDYMFTLKDLQCAFEEARLTHPMVGFKHDTFEEFMETKMRGED